MNMISMDRVSIEDSNWKLRAACRGTSQPNLWFSTRREDQEIVQELCNRCPVKDICLHVSLVRGELWGTWGGVGQRERRRELRVDPSAS